MANELERIFNKLEYMDAQSTARHEDVIQRLTRQETIEASLSNNLKALETTVDRHSDEIAQTKGFFKYVIGSASLACLGVLKHIWFGKVGS